MVFVVRKCIVDSVLDFDVDLIYGVNYRIFLYMLIRILCI